MKDIDVYSIILIVGTCIMGAIAFAPLWWDVIEHSPIFPNEVISICDYNSCCSDDISIRYSECDHIGCENIIPNWTPPNCSVTP